MVSIGITGATKTPKTSAKGYLGVALIQRDFWTRYRNFLRSLSSHLRTYGEMRFEITPAPTLFSISMKVSIGCYPPLCARLEFAATRLL